MRQQLKFLQAFLALAVVVSGVGVISVNAQAASVLPPPGIWPCPTIIPHPTIFPPTPFPTIIPHPTIIPLPTIIPHPTIFPPTPFPTIVPYTPLPTTIPFPPPYLRSGIWGQITISPICPVETIHPLPCCAPRPYQTTIAVIRVKDGKEVARFTSDKFGYFKEILLPGVYRLEGTNTTRYPHLNPVTVIVKPGVFTHVNLVFDSGIR